MILCQEVHGSALYSSIQWPISPASILDAKAITGADGDEDSGMYSCIPVMWGISCRDGYHRWALGDS